MRRALLCLLGAAVLVAGGFLRSLSDGDSGRGVAPARDGRSMGARSAGETWGNPASLPDHFARHGADFHARDAEDYARQAWALGERAKAGGLLVKVDVDGVRRVFDPQTGAFAAFNANGTTKTFFKPNSRDYFDRQPGRLVNH